MSKIPPQTPQNAFLHSSNPMTDMCETEMTDHHSKSSVTQLSLIADLTVS